jgi:glycosyltransferase involved in cell wall biosynthesis
MTPFDAICGRRFFLYVSRIEPRKNHAVLLDSLSKVKDKDVILVFAGHVTLEVEMLQRKISELGLIGRVLFVTPSDAQLCWLYKHSEASFYPSWCEGFGIPILEAKLAGGLSYCAANSAMKDLEQYIDGMFNSGDSESISRLMGEVLKGNLGSVDTADKILTDFSWKRSAKALQQMM